MQSARLIVKNFGPLKDVDIEVTDFLCLIGKQATGKSTIAKLIAIFENENFGKNNRISFENNLEEYGMLSFLTTNSTIHFYKGIFENAKDIGNVYHFEYENEKMSFLNFRDHYKNKIKNGFIEKQKKDDIQTNIKFLILSDYIFNNRLHDNINEVCDLVYENLKKINEETEIDDYFENLETIFEKDGIYVKYDSQYIPSERNFLHIIAENVFGLINNDIKIPKHLLEIGQEYEKALNTVKEIPLTLIDKNFKYKREGKTSYIYHNNEDKVDLLQSASGLQSILPIILLIEYAKTLKDNYLFNYVIEEPELNIYPETQHQLMQYLIKNIFDSKSENYQRKKLIITTHSPYILASINNLLLAFIKGQEKPKETQKIIKKNSWMNPKLFNAYELKNGKSFRIMNDNLGQIKSNIIDSVTDKFSDEFDKLLAL